MQISVTGRHLDITDAIRNHALDKIQHDFAPFTRIEHVRVILDIEKHRRRAEVIVQGKNHLHAEALEESDEMYASIDRAVEKVAKQLRRARDKKQNHKSREKLADVEYAVSQREQANEEPV